MKTTTVAAHELGTGPRLDARYYSAPAIEIRRLLRSAHGLELRTLGGIDGVATITSPNRFKRTYAAPGEDYIPYLRPYDIFEYLPRAADLLSRTRTENLNSYIIKPDDLLQTCSGRNLGPVTIADSYLSQFALSHDMIRLTISNKTERYNTLAFMQSQYGQSLIRGDLSGSVIDHVTTEHLANLEIPFFPEIMSKVASLMVKARRLRESARVSLSSHLDNLDAVLQPHLRSTTPKSSGWELSSTALSGRLDAEFHSIQTSMNRQDLLALGGSRLGDVATLQKPGGRYKTYYVEATEGNPLISGRQLLQMRVIAPKHIADRSISLKSKYQLIPKSVCFQADGRAEEGLGRPVLITSDRSEWLGSGHIGRAIPENAEDAGWLWASLASASCQNQISSAACGSVVDALYTDDLAEIILPPKDLVDSADIIEHWEMYAKSQAAESQAIRMIEDAIEASV
jgi:hypothetical protein